MSRSKKFEGASLEARKEDQGKKDCCIVMRSVEVEDIQFNVFSAV